MKNGVTINEKLRQLLTSSGIVNPERRNNTAVYLFEILIWQELKKIATSELFDAWDRAQTVGPLPKDDELRARDSGEFTPTKTKTMAFQVQIKRPPKKFDLTTYIGLVSKRHKIPVRQLNELIDQANIEGTPALVKRVLEI